jgi:1,4-alpha-glucan branching enzyme
MKKGAFTFVLHSHLPYCRMAGRWPHGEEWLHEAASETYLPLLNALYDLKESGYPIKLTLGLTPVLAEQLADPLVLDHFEIYLEQNIEAAESDIARFQRADEPHLEYLATFFRDWYGNILTTFRDRFGRDVVGAFKKLQDEGYLEIITSAATHGYLPLLSRDSSIYGQLKAGVESYRRLFGREPRAIWLPECAYRPAFYAEADGERYYKPGLEEFLAELDLGCFFSETHTIEGGLPVGKAAGDAVGYGDVPKRIAVPLPDYVEPTEKTTYQPYYVAGGRGEGAYSPVAVVGRNNRTGMQVWSADWGYPGDYDYLEFHKKDGVSGLRYWRVTGARVDLGQKDYYHPDWAAYKVGEHSRHFAWLVGDLVSQYQEESGEFGLIASNYDTELFGHWWFEGIDWMREVLRILSQSETVELTTASEFIEQHPPEDVLALPEGSWGMGGGHWTWDNHETHWMWKPIHEAERRMEQLVVQHPDAQGDLAEVLNQAARELLLMQSSDWPFLVTTGQAREYAIIRFNEHLERFNQLADVAEAGQADPTLVAELYERDKLFPNIDYRWFGEREGSK